MTILFNECHSGQLQPHIMLRVRQHFASAPRFDVPCFPLNSNALNHHQCACASVCVCARSYFTCICYMHAPLTAMTALGLNIHGCHILDGTKLCCPHTSFRPRVLSKFGVPFETFSPALGGTNAFEQHVCICICICICICMCKCICI